MALKNEHRRSRPTPPPRDDLSAEWRLLLRAALFFAACAAVFGALLVIGLFH
jgi:hypothetical protein